MKITWYGHAAFRLEGLNPAGRLVRIVLDPYNHPGCGGYLPVGDEADVTCVSHDNVRYHSDTSALRGDFTRLQALEFAGGAREAHGVRFESCLVHENDRGEGPNAMVKLELEGITVAHQGDLGHALAGEALAFLRGVDVLLALAGGPPTIALLDLVAAIGSLRPAIVIPMHFKTPKVNLKILPVDSFLAEAGRFPLDRPGTTSLEVTRASLPRETRIVLLEHAR